jgi:hypothetical protein
MQEGKAKVRPSGSNVYHVIHAEGPAFHTTLSRLGDDRGRDEGVCTGRYELQDSCHAQRRVWENMTVVQSLANEHIRYPADNGGPRHDQRDGIHPLAHNIRPASCVLILDHLEVIGVHVEGVVVVSGIGMKVCAGRGDGVTINLLKRVCVSSHKIAQHYIA